MIPNYLYHYTSIESLLLILHNQTFRFKRLDKVNDPLEGENPLFPNSKQYVFSSSWTAEFIDELPMWKIYTDLKGVRLRMPIDLFSYKNPMVIKKVGNNTNFLIESKLNKGYSIELEQAIDFNNELIDEFKISSVFGPTKVEYSSAQENLSENVNRKDDRQAFDFHEININLIGQRKINFWSFEKEYRYRVFFNDAIMIAGSDNILNEFLEKNQIKTDYIDIEYNKESLEGIEIILGPDTNIEDERLINEVLLKKGIRKFEIKKSKIQIK